jgi:UrcA family protein
MTHKRMFSTLNTINGPKTSGTVSVQVALVALGIALTGIAAAQNNAAAQDSANHITVVATHGVQKKQVGMSHTGIPIEEVSLNRHVSVHDLDLTTPAGKTELEKRINAVAKEACSQLQTLYPLEQWETDNRTCIADAVKGAMKQVETRLASSPGK